MKPGDLVTYHFQLLRGRLDALAHVGLIVETGKYTGNRDVKVLWARQTEPEIEDSQHLALVRDVRIP